MQVPFPTLAQISRLASHFHLLLSNFDHHLIRQRLLSLHTAHPPHSCISSTTAIMDSTTASSPVASTPSSTTMQCVPRKEAYYKPSAEEWERVRLTIRQLYIDEKKTLSEVSEILGTNHNFYASPKQYKNRFKQWGLWKNLSTRDAARLIQLKESRDSIGKTSTLVRAGQKVDFDRVEKTIRRSKNRIPKSTAEDKQPKLGRPEPAAPARNQPSRVECRTPSPEPCTNKDLDMLDSLDPSCSRSSHNDTLSNEFGDFLPGSDSFVPFVSSISDAVPFEPFGASRFEDPFVETIWDCYARTHHKLALRCEWLRTNSLYDPILERFRSDNALLAILEPLVATNGLMRESFLANFLSSFEHRPELSEFALGVRQTIEQAVVAKNTSQHVAVIERAVQYLGLQTYTRRFIRTTKDSDPIQFPTLSGEDNPSLMNETPDGLSPGLDFPSPGTEMPPTPPSCNDYDNGPNTNEFEASAFAFHLGEIDTAEIRLRALTSYEGPVSAKGQVLMRLAWYCLSRVQRETGRAEEADGSLMQAIRGSTFYPATDGTDWDEVSYLFT
ncbi:hypothetical protein KVR01_010603 [Diaporthe batatas]|uniref:uncharacterized protein n=1 Tax=Diaporthe batatas TaxID=748121 RepID=UPI001D056C9A|nr:uncharacterized protein KVR01_010603 [Diaporthe batatas]KAG8159966.1 hypothetical protein KVR01_010603 [Diaporthe batatas]